MCGFAGILDLRANPKTNPDLLKKMGDIITHRGPDSDGQWLSDDKKIGLSFRRLSIVDLSSNGSQPMHSSDNRFVITFNGEIYNHNEIKKEFFNDLDYKSNTDTETILNSFHKFGNTAPDKFIGMWAIAIWDKTEEKLFLCRDRVGVKPLYYYHKDNLFVFGSEIKSILLHPDIKTELNHEELPNYLNFGMSSNRESLFKNIRKLESGSWLEINNKGEVKKVKYWNCFNNFNKYSELNRDEVVAELRNLLKESIKTRMMSDVPFGVFLSGGIDSSLNVALMSELMTRPVDTFTVGFKDLEKFNELKYARQVAELFKTNHHEILIDDKDSYDILEKLPWYEDEPNADPVCIPLYFLSKLTRDSGTTVVQVGEGSDEQFIGYKWMIQGYKFYKNYWNLYYYFPSIFKKLLFNFLKGFFENKNQFLALDYFRRASYSEEFYWSGVSIFSPSHLKNLMNNKNSINLPYKYVKELYSEISNINNHADYFQKVLYLELKQRLAEILLMRVDKIGMAHSIEARVPFLDHRIIEFSMSLTPKMKLPNFDESKILLKKAAENILPKDIIYRQKQGFAAPVENWFRGPWKNYLEDKLLNSNFSKLNILNKNEIKNYLNLHNQNKKNYGQHLYSLLNLNLWYDKFFN